MKSETLMDFFKSLKAAGKKVKLTYYAAAGQCMFFVQALDEGGNRIPRRHPQSGSFVYSGNKQQFEEVRETFSPMVTTRSTKADALCFRTVESDDKGEFTLYQQALIAKLEEMADDPSSPVKRESEYKREKNPAAWEREQELEKLKAEIGTRETAAFEKGKKAATSEIDKLKQQLAEAEEMLSKQTEPEHTGKPKK